MSSAPVIARIARLLRPDAPPEQQTAAALVLGELRARDPEVVAGLVALLGSPLPGVQRHALAALAAIGAPRALPAVVALLSARDEGVRVAAREAVTSFGEAALPIVRARLASAPAAEKRTLEEVLARLGGRDALAALLEGLAPDDLEAARAATLPLRQRLREADARERRRTLDQAAQFLAGKRAGASTAARVAALKVLGFLEDPAAIPALLGRARDRREAEAVRLEAIIALRLAARSPDPRLAAELVTIAETGSMTLARAALYSLVGVTLPGAAARALGRRLAKLAFHAESDRAVLAIELLAGIPGAESAAALSRVLLETADRPRAEAAAGALDKRPDAAEALVAALLTTRQPERAQMLAALLRPRLRGSDGGKSKLDARLARAAVEHLANDHPCTQPVLQAARIAAPALLAEQVRALAEKLRKARRPERALAVLRVLGHSADASPEDGYALAALELNAGRREEALTIIQQLLDRGFDVAAAIRKDRSLPLERRYQVGFHFAERGHPLGEEVLSAIVESGGRTKIAQMARAKLRSSGLASG